MKKISLLVIITCFSVSLSYSQKAKVQTAYNFFKEPYQQYDKAKEAIDEAVQNEQSAAMPKAWYYRGQIYQSLYSSEKYKSLCNNCLIIAYESYQKALQLDPKNEWADEINTYWIPKLSNDIFNQALASYNAQKYSDALAQFEQVSKMIPSDTAVILNCALSAQRAENNPKAKEYLQKLIDMKYNKESIYADMGNILKSEKDIDGALAVIRKGRAEFPGSMNLMLSEINILLGANRHSELTSILDEATKKDPNNPDLYMALGSTYENLANPEDAAAKAALKPEDQAAYLLKAEESYRKGLTIAPDNYILNYNLGALIFNQAADMANKANNIKSNDEFAKAQVKFNAKFKEAEPYLEKAKEKNPKKDADDLSTYKNTLQSLKQLYVRTAENQKYEQIRTELDGK